MEGERSRAEREAKLNDLRMHLILDFSNCHFCLWTFLASHGGILFVDSKGTEENTLAHFASRCWSSGEDGDNFTGNSGNKNNQRLSKTVQLHLKFDHVEQTMSSSRSLVSFHWFRLAELFWNMDKLAIRIAD